MRSVGRRAARLAARGRPRGRRRRGRRRDPRRRRPRPGRRRRARRAVSAASRSRAGASARTRRSSRARSGSRWSSASGPRSSPPRARSSSTGMPGRPSCEPGRAAASRRPAPPPARERATTAAGSPTAARPARTRDGHDVAVLANVSSAAEVAVALGYGADGAGLVRTELAFLDAAAWPTERRAPARAGAACSARCAAGRDGARARLRRRQDTAVPRRARRARAAVCSCARRRHSPRSCARVLRGGPRLPPAHPAADGRELARARGTRSRSCARPRPPPACRSAARRDDRDPGRRGGGFDLAGRADFLSIGTNDLTCATLGERPLRRRRRARAHDPRVLALIARTVAGRARRGHAPSRSAARRPPIRSPFRCSSASASTS